MTDTVNPTADTAGGAETIDTSAAQIDANDTQQADTGGKQPGTVLDGGDTGGDDQASKQRAPSNWADDWRERFAGVAKPDEREKLMKRLSRFSSPEGIFKSYLEMDRKLSSGALKQSLPADATPEQLAEWRKENGLPEKPEEYKFEFADGFVPSEEDKGLLADFAKLAHERNTDPKLANDFVGWYFAKQQEAQAVQFETDTKRAGDAAEALRAEYGPEFRMNMTGVKNMLENTFGQEVGSALVHARLPDGSRIGDNPEVMKGLVAIARQTMPGAGLMPAGTADVGKSINDEIAHIEGLMKERSSKYWSDEKMQARYRDLLTARERMAA